MAKKRLPGQLVSNMGENILYMAKQRLLGTAIGLPESDDKKWEIKLTLAIPRILAPVQFSDIKRYECNTPSRHGVTYEQYKKPPPMSHDEKNMCLNRPMSPHVTIYAPTLPAMTSIVQRATGIMLYGYALLLAGGALFLPNGIETYVSMIQSLDLSENCILAARMLIAAPFMYHYFIGMRFIMWNAGKLLSMKQIYATAWVSILAAIIGTVCGAYYTV